MLARSYLGKQPDLPHLVATGRLLDGTGLYRNPGMQARRNFERRAARFGLKRTTLDWNSPRR